jgi:hypothetical protein
MLNYQDEMQTTEIAGTQYDVRQIEPSKIAQRIIEDEFSHILNSGKPSKKFVPIMS